MDIKRTAISDVVLVELKVFEDARGAFFEAYHAEKFEKLGLPTHFVQDNQSISRKHVLRGLHFQNPFPQGKLVRVLSGSIYDVCVDLRRSSATFGRHVGVTLTSETRHELYVPPGFAHGFLTLDDNTQVLYKCTEVYKPDAEMTLLWNDPELGIKWPVSDPLLSEKDLNGLSLEKYLLSSRCF